MLELVSSVASTDAAPASVTEGLRDELRQAISVRDAADARATIASEICSRGERAMLEAAELVARLKAELDEARSISVERAAQRFAEALRAGSDLPAMPVAPEADSAALTQALGLYDALLAAVQELAVERNRAGTAAASANAEVHKLVEDITDSEAREIGIEMVSAIELHWRLLNKLAGIALLDDARFGGPRLRGFQQELLVQIDRHKAAVTRNPLMIERHNYKSYLDGLAADAKLAWQNYQWRLALDADAKLEGEK